jgi:large subunit ribosomal protein L21
VYAIIQALGHQYRVRKGDQVTIDRVPGKAGDQVNFDKVLFVGSDKPVFGSPLVKGASVKAVIKEQTRDEKVLVFKYRRRKNYKKTQGHRQPVTVIEISDIQV